MKAENDQELEVAKLLPEQVLLTRMGFDPLLSGIVTRLIELHGKTGQPFGRPFDETDHSENVPVLLAEAMARLQALSLEVKVVNASRGRPSGQMVLAESKVRELEMVLVQAVRLSIEIHLHLNGIG